MNANLSQSHSLSHTLELWISCSRARFYICFIWLQPLARFSGVSNFENRTDLCQRYDVGIIHTKSVYNKSISSFWTSTDKDWCWLDSCRHFGRFVCFSTGCRSQLAHSLNIAHIFLTCCRKLHSFYTIINFNSSVGFFSSFFDTIHKFTLVHDYICQTFQIWSYYFGLNSDVYCSFVRSFCFLLL